MPTIIKAADRARGIQGVAFNFDDMAEKADEYLQQVRAQAAAIIAKASADAIEISRRAEGEGHRAGRQDVEKMVEKQIGDQVATLLPALRHVVRDIHDAKQAWLSHWEKAAMHVAVAIAERVIRRQLSQTPQITLTLVREALELASGSSTVQIRMNPEDLQTLAAQVQAITKELCPLAATELVADEEISRGGCRVETAFGRLDQQFEAQLARIEEELT